MARGALQFFVWSALGMLVFASGCSKDNEVDQSKNVSAGSCTEKPETLAQLCPPNTALEVTNTAGDNVCPEGAGDVKDKSGNTTAVCKTIATCAVRCKVIQVCGNGTCEEDERESCAPGAAHCFPCAKDCAGKCKPTDAPTCIGTKVLACGPNGEPTVELIDCAASGQLCSAGKCVGADACGNGICESGEGPGSAKPCPEDCAGACSPGATRCKGSSAVLTCSADGKTEAETACPSGKVCGVSANGATCNDAGVCGNGACESGEGEGEAKPCPQDCKKATCGNGTCEVGESSQTCPDDCKKAVCGNDVCELDEQTSCPQDCPKQVCKPQVRQCIGSELQVCNANGTELAGKIDCKDSGQVCGNGQCQAADVCGNGVCEKGETLDTCQFDCSAKCGNKICEKPFEDPIKCADDCPNECGDGKCSAGETHDNCAGDCPASCGNGVCDASENHDSCSKDCFCGNHVCEDQETTATALPAGSTLISCPQDCSVLTCTEDKDCNDKIACTKDVCKKESGQATGKCEYPPDNNACNPGERCLGSLAYDTDVPNSGCCADKDGDGKAATRCGGNDCYDSPDEVNAPFYKGADPASVYPGAPEPCDGVDHNCNGANAPKTDATPTQLTSNFGDKKLFGAARLGSTVLAAWLGEAGGEPVVQYLLLDAHDGPLGSVQKVPLPSGLNFSAGNFSIPWHAVQVVASPGSNRFGVAFRTCASPNEQGAATYRVAWVDAKTGALAAGSPISLPISPAPSCGSPWDFVAVGGAYYLTAPSSTPLRISESGGVTAAVNDEVCESLYYGALGSPSRLIRVVRAPDGFQFGVSCGIAGAVQATVFFTNDATGASKGYSYIPFGYSTSHEWRRIWDGDAITEIHDRGYRRISLDGKALFNEEVWDKGGNPRPISLGVSDQAIGGQPLVLALFGDEPGASVYSVVRKQDGSKALDTGILATGTDVADGFVAWDAKAAGFQAYYSSAPNGVHQIFSVPVVCELACPGPGARCGPGRGHDAPRRRLCGRLALRKPPWYRALSMKRSFLALAALAALAAYAPGCHSHNEAEHPGHHDHEHGDHEHGDHHHGDHDHDKEHKGGHELKGALKSFHDVLAPVYHMEKGTARNDKACDAVPSMKTEAAKVAAEPSSDAVMWKAKADALGRDIDGLDQACKVTGRADVPAKLELVHDSFHALMEAQK